MSTELLERHDGFSRVRNALRFMAAERDLWAGIPMPLSDADLIIEPRYPHASALMMMGAKAAEEKQAVDEGLKVRAVFWSSHLRADVIVMTQADGAITYGIDPGVHHFDHDIKTLGNSVAWGIEQEANAVQLLATLVPHHTFKMYMLTGMFLETSERSGMTYCFRRLRPTVAIRADSGRMRIRASLCMHPIGYYSGSFAGAMCPTDDVIAHLMMMRGDERRYWARCNQHPAHRPEAAL